MDDKELKEKTFTKGVENSSNETDKNDKSFNPNRATD